MFSGKPMDAPERLRDQLSVAVLFVGAIAICGIGALQLAKDGSLWRDEASVAVSLLKLSPRELLGRLDGAQSFPRLYLLAVAGLKGVFGYHTLTLRALPFLFFVSGTVGWMWLLHRRFRAEPQLLALGVLLTLIPATWFIQAAMFKPYTFDVFAALVPFLLSDRFYTSILERGERPWRILLVTALCALSYPFALVLVARIAGWWVSRLARRRFAVSPLGLGVALGSMLLFFGCLWLTDLRHTSEISETLRRFWSSCVLGEPGSSTLSLLDGFLFGWYTGDPDFSSGGGLPSPLVLIVKLAFALGIVGIAASVLRWRGCETAQPQDWGSRSLGHAAVLCGVACASLFAGYPICPGRLTLFALLSLQIVTLEGLAWASAGFGRVSVPRSATFIAGLALAAAVAPTSLHDASRLLRNAAPDDLRPGLASMGERPELPMISTSCTVKQIETLPEGIDHPVFLVGPRGDWPKALANREAWILYSRAPYCRNQIRSLRVASSSWTEHYKQPFASRLIHAEFPEQ